MPKFKNYKFCPHCKYDVHKSTYFRHKGLYFQKGKWCETVCGHESEVSTENCPSDCEMKKSLNRDGAGSSTEAGCQASDQVIYGNTDFTNFEETNDISEGSSDKNACNESRPSINDETSEEPLLEIWPDDDLSDVQFDINMDQQTNSQFQGESGMALNLINWILLFISVWASYFNISSNAIEHLLHFFKAFFQICGYSMPLMALVAGFFPISLYSLFKIQGCRMDTFKKLVVCPKCFCVYDYKDCLQEELNSKHSKRCSYIRFPKHPQANKRMPCGELLLKEVKLKNSKTVFYPRKTFCFNGIINPLKSFLDRPGFEENCEQWRRRESVPGTYRDIYDGKMWRKFLDYKDGETEERPFLSKPRHFGFMLNLDWFQPFKYSPYSIGVLYLVILNLPREIRFKEENVILVAIIPGPREPNGEQMNFFLEPIVNELATLWKDGIEYKSNRYYGVLLACACDLPAGRKLCGLLSFSAKIGCSKCTKEFRTEKFGCKTDYGGFTSRYPARNYSVMTREAKRAKKAKTQAERQAIEKAAGVRWNELMRLPYFNPVDMLIVDPMHNLYLGTAKHMLKEIWPKNSSLDNTAMAEIQTIVDNSDLPNDVGRIPFKIASNFSNFTSDQFKNWVLYFSLYAMKPYLSKTAHSVWINFVEACWLYNRPVISLKEISKAHESIMKFNKDYETWLKGTSCSTPNQHFHIHLIEYILDYGPFYSFWLYSFERYNGILGAFPNNQRSVEIQIIRKFLRNQKVLHMPFPEQHVQHFEQCFSFLSLKDGSTTVQVIKDVAASKIKNCLKVSNESLLSCGTDQSFFCDNSLLKMLGDSEPGYLESILHKQYLHEALEACLGELERDKILGAYMKYFSAEYMGQIYGSIKIKNGKNCHILANSWVGNDGCLNLSSNKDHPGEIEYFLKMFIPVNDKYECINLAYVHWFQRHPKVAHFGSDLATVWCKSMFEIDGPASFIPIKKIKGKFVSGFTQVDGESVRVVIPKSNKIYW